MLTVLLFSSIVQPAAVVGSTFTIVRPLTITESVAVSPSSAVTVTAIISPVVALAGTVYVEVAPTTVPLSDHSYFVTAALAVAVSVSPTLHEFFCS